MSMDDVRNGRLVHALRTLPGADADRARAERIRNRCHRALARRQPVARWPWGPAVASALGAMYLVEIVRRALGLFG